MTIHRVFYDKNILLKSEKILWFGRGSLSSSAKLIALLSLALAIIIATFLNIIFIVLILYLIIMYSKGHLVNLEKFFLNKGARYIYVVTQNRVIIYDSISHSLLSSIDICAIKRIIITENLNNWANMTIFYYTLDHGHNEAKIYKMKNYHQFIMLIEEIKSKAYNLKSKEIRA